ILADPPESGEPGVGPLEQRRRIDANFVFERLESGKTAGKLLQSATQDVVVVGSPGIARNPGELWFAIACRVRLWAVIQLPDADHGPGRSEQVARIVADGGAPVREVSHRTGEAIRNPAVVSFRVGGG